LLVELFLGVLRFVTALRRRRGLFLSDFQQALSHCGGHGNRHGADRRPSLALRFDRLFLAHRTSQR
jgi:hypothetical protein